MYQPPVGLVALPVTGAAFLTAHYVVGAITLIFAGLALLRLVPRKES